MEDYVKTYNGECPVDKPTEENDTGQAVQGGSENEAQELIGDMGEGQGQLLPRPIKKKEPNGFQIIRLS